MTAAIFSIKNEFQYLQPKSEKTASYVYNRKVEMHKNKIHFKTTLPIL